jgi:formylglycine-generating enzyme required for sulfatase activity
MAAESSDANDIADLQRQIADLQARLAARQDADGDPPRTTIDTQGGAAVEGSVAAGGHFIGRDFILVIGQLVQRGEDPGEFQAVIAHYLAALAGDLAGLKLGEIDVAASDTRREPLQLADVYVPLATQLHIPQETALAQWLLRDRRPGRSERAEIETQRETRAVSTLEALSQHRQLTLLGAAGSGKSTFGASVLLTLAQVWQGHLDQLAKLGEQRTHGALLPIRVILRRFAEQLPAGSGPVHAGDLWAFIGRDLEASGYGLSTETRKYVQRIARDRGALFVLDGLDECGSEATRQRVFGAVDELLRSAGQQCRFLLTARPYAWPGGADPAQGVYALADFNDEQIEQFIRAWYAALARRQWLSPGEADRKLTDLLAARQRPDLLPLARNPLLLTLMASLHANRGRLPDDRADLYNDSVDLLMLRWNRQIGADKALLDELAIPTLKLSNLREVLEELAFAVHAESLVYDRRLDADQAATSGAGGTADIGEGRLLQAFRPLLERSWDKAAVVVDYIEKRAGLLLGQGDRNGERQFAFPHRTFQEFLAACHLAARQDFASDCARLAREAPGHWQVVLPLAARIAKAERGASAADALIGGTAIADFRRTRPPDAADWTRALLAAMQLLEIGVGAIRQRGWTSAIATRVADWLAASLPVHPEDGGAASVLRARAGDVLAQLGDPRFDPQRFYLPTDEMLGFVRIAADPGFMIGTRSADVGRVSQIISEDVPAAEINNTAAPVPEFYIARYPVTVGQFRAFVQATACEIGDEEALQAPDNRPVCFVKWKRALAWCKWLNEVLTTSPVFGDSPIASLVREHHWSLGLPSEIEWEKAARGGWPALVFPWGDHPDPNRANYDDSSIDHTSAVGCFPATGFGLHDMVGNVWEWTQSPWSSYPYDGSDVWREDWSSPGEALRVVRGGSWSLHRGLARCAARSGLQPGNWGDLIGFRVVLRSSPVL